MKHIILGLLILPVIAMAQLIVQPPSIITTDKVNPAIVISGTTNQIAPYLAIKNQTGTILTITTNGVIASAATTNQMVFAATNTAPADTNAVRWISVRVVGDTNQYRLPLCK